jgi:hypothetical protein
MKADWQGVAGRVAARAIFDEHTLDALVGNFRQHVLVDEVILAFFAFGASARRPVDTPRGRVLLAGSAG